MTSRGEVVGLRAGAGRREKISSVVIKFKISFSRSPCNGGSDNNLYLRSFIPFDP